ncbi:MAG: SDR family oxidoreductase [Bryobacteraceae bacterium]|nr:SDR family oxidoreductase [Bryobacteraceae bacterium]
MDLKLRDQVAVITGAASGIGLACAEALAREGCRVALWDASPRVKEMAAPLGWGCVVDVRDYAAVQAAVVETEEALGAVSHLVHAAARGSGRFGFPFTNLHPEDWKEVLDVNILGTVHVAQALAVGMMARRAGTMVFIASVAGQIGSQTDPPYSASKAANLNFAQCLAKDLAPYGVRVNTVNPGMVKTPLNENVWRAWHDAQPPESRLSYEAWAEAKIRAVSPLGRWQEPAEIADMVAFLSSARAAQVTGQSINVDGGQVMHW